MTGFFVRFAPSPKSTPKAVSALRSATALQNAGRRSVPRYLDGRAVALVSDLRIEAAANLLDACMVMA
jgi:hypothetical protein